MSKEESKEHIHMQPPEAFNFEAPERWPLWRKRFNRFITCSGIQNRSQKDQIDYLIYIMGPEAEDAIQRFAEVPETLEGALDLFDKLFQPQTNVIFERFKFNSRCQQPGETVSNFITDLYTLASKCNYGDLKEDLIRDRIVVGMQDAKISEVMQMKSTLTLNQAVDMATLAEIQKSQSLIVKQISTCKVQFEKFVCILWRCNS